LNLSTGKLETTLTNDFSTASLPSNQTLFADTMTNNPPIDYSMLKELILAFPDIVKCEGESRCFDLLEHHLHVLTEYRKSLSQDEDRREMEEFRRILLSTLHQSEFGKYVWDKPRGYAGDFVTQEMIWFGRTGGSEYRYRGTTEVGKLLTSLTLDTENCKANEERINRLRTILSGNVNKIASIACGSCIELWQLADTIKENTCDIFLLDQDEGALNRAQERIGHPSGCSITFNNENILRFITRNNKQNVLSNQDIIYAFGLFDYFKKDTCVKIVKALWKSVAPNGMLLTTNAHPSNPTRLWMEYAGDWFLDYKDEQTMYDLTEGLSDIYDVRLSIDRFGVYQYLEIIKRN